MKLSIIIPMYNAEHFIGKCLNSIFAEVGNNKEVEVLLVNDGSTDGSRERSGKFTYHNLKIYDRPNRGVSASRNYGIMHAVGDWVMFVDADDYMLPGWFQIIKMHFEDNADVIIFNKDIPQNVKKEHC